jgi:protein-L-isoaspartate(D-aspartate) O-methyltransferase
MGAEDSQDAPGAAGAAESADAAAAAGNLDRERANMVANQIEARGLTDPELVRAFRTVPRELFVESFSPYGDQALPIEEGQTISQPFVVAFMTDAARPPRPDGWRRARVLEIGTGSGYQAAILSELGADVTTVERHAELSRRAGEALQRAGYRDVHLVVGDGTRGVPENAPYDSVIVTAAGPSVPTPLLEQLDPEGGRLVMPVGAREHQWLTLVERRGDEFTSKALEPVVFVPLLGEHGFGGGGAPER